MHRFPRAQQIDHKLISKPNTDLLALKVLEVDQQSATDQSHLLLDSSSRRERYNNDRAAQHAKKG